MGWTSNYCGNSASVSSPLTAASATFALNAGVWFRRGRLLMFSPVRLPSWPPAGRNSNYPAVQILPASSERLFGLIPQQAIRRGSFRSVGELVQKIDAYVASYNLHRRPFVWTDHRRFDPC